MSKLSKLWVSVVPVLFVFLAVATLITARPGLASAQTTNPPTGGNAATDTSGEVSDESCEKAGGDFSFGLCPLLRMSNEGIQLLDRKIRSLLEVDPKYFEAIPAGKPNAGHKPVQEIWASFRNIAAILLIPILLFLVIGTALGFSVVDAYTVKRAMPRLLIAVIFMALSYDICLIMIDITTALGRGVGGIVAVPFGGANNLTLPALFSPPTVGGGGGGGFSFKTIISAGSNVLVPGAGQVVDKGFSLAGGILAFVSLGAAGLASVGILASFLFIAFILLMIIFILLTIREIVIVFLVVMSPLAILSWIFPGNDKLWKTWWDTFTKLLLVYPVISGLIMMGRGFAALINSANSAVDPSTIEAVFFVIVKLFVYIGPFFLILFVLKILTGVFGTLTGMVNDRSKGLFDRQRNYRANKRKELGEMSKAGTRYNKTPFIGKSAPLMKASRAIGYGRNAGVAAQDLGANPLAWKRRMGHNLRTERSTQDDGLAGEFAEKNTDFKTISGDDAKLYAAKYRNKEEIERALVSFDEDRFGGPENIATREAAVQQIMRAQTGASKEVFQRARIRAMAKTGTGYINQDKNSDNYGEFEADRMLDDINEAYGDDRNGAGRALAEMRGSLANSGQIAGLAGFGTWAGALENMHYARPQDRAAVAASAHDRIMSDAADSVTPGQAMYGKPSSARALATAHRNRIGTIVQEVNMAENESVVAQQDLAVVQNGVAAGTHTNAQLADATLRAQQAAQRFNTANSSLDAATAAAAGLLDAMNHSASPANASAFANELMGVRMAVRSGSGTAGPQAGPPITISVRDLIDERMNNEEYRNRRRDMGARSLSDAQAALNATRTPGGGTPGGLSGGVPGAGGPTS